jgi:hypothetical protein
MSRAQSETAWPGVVHSLIKDCFMRKIVLAAAAVAGVFALSACKGQEAAPSDAGTEASTEAAAEATTAAAN